MAEKSRDHGEAVRCPICGSPGESGCIYGPDGAWTGLQWRAGEPSILGNALAGVVGGMALGEVELFRGSYVRGIRCVTCRRIVLEYSGGEDGPGSELVERASDLEQEGEWDRAIVLYRRVIEEPGYRSHHQYARKGIEAIEEKRSSSNDGA